MYFEQLFQKVQNYYDKDYYKVVEDLVNFSMEELLDFIVAEYPSLPSDFKDVLLKDIYDNGERLLRTKVTKDIIEKKNVMPAVYMATFITGYFGDNIKVDEYKITTVKKWWELGDYLVAKAIAKLNSKGETYDIITNRFDDMEDLLNNFDKYKK